MAGAEAVLVLVAGQVAELAVLKGVEVDSVLAQVAGDQVTAWRLIEVVRVGGILLRLWPQGPVFVLDLVQQGQLALFVIADHGQHASVVVGRVEQPLVLVDADVGRG